MTRMRNPMSSKRSQWNKNSITDSYSSFAKHDAQKHTGS